MEAKDVLAAFFMLIYQHLTNLYNESVFAWKLILFWIFLYILVSMENTSQKQALQQCKLPNKCHSEHVYSPFSLHWECSWMLESSIKMYHEEPVMFSSAELSFFKNIMRG